MTAPDGVENISSSPDSENGGERPVTFADLGLSPKVLEAVAAAGYTTPTPIQAGSIPHALQGRDILGIAQTGTGKTASFVLPMLTRLEKGRARARMPRTLILEPTRELAAQVQENFDQYGKNHKLNVALLIGGVSFEEQERKLERGADVLIATPGRLLDHFQRGKLLMTGVEILVIDEADRMLDMGFIPDIERICKLLPVYRQTLFFSATMPPEITRLADQFLQAPVRVEVSRPATTAENITQRLVGSGRKPHEKRAVLRSLIDQEGDGIKNAIIFCNRKVDVSELFRSLTRHGYDAGALHGDMDQRARMKMLAAFREGQLKLLVASDVAARGLDIPDVSHVFNFDVPVNAEDYVHRIGRTGRAGRSGKAFTIVTRADTRLLDAVQSLIGMKIPWLEGALPVTEEESGPEEKERKKPASRKARPAKEPKAPREPRPAKEPAATKEARPAKPVASPEAAPSKTPPKSAEKPTGKPAGKQRRQPRDEEPVVLGFGDDMPDFMKITV